MNNILHIPDETRSTVSSKFAAWRAWLGRREVWLFILLLVSSAYFFPRWAQWGANTKLDLMMAIVDQGMLSIDDYYQNTGDYALYKGVHYSDKAPGTSFLGVPFYAIFKMVARTSLVDKVITRLSASAAMTDTLQEGGTGILKDKVYFAMAMTFVVFFVASLPSALLGVIMYRFLGYFAPNPFPRILIVVVYGLATVAFPASQTLDRQLVAALTFSAFYLLFRIKRGELNWHWLWLIGLFMGWSGITDYPTGLILVGLFVYAFFAVRQKKHLLALVGGGIPPALLAMLCNYACFETVLPTGYFHSELYTDLHYTGFLSLTYPKLDVLWGLTFSPFRGLFYRSPFLLLALPGFWFMGRDRAHRPEMWMCLWAVISFFLFNSSSAMWWGGNRAGPTYMIPMVPYMAIPIVYFSRNRIHLGWHKALVGVLTVWSFLFVWVETVGGQSFPDLTPNPIWTLSLPAVLRGDIARNWGMLLELRGPVSLLPLLVLAVPLVYLLTRRSSLSPAGPQSASEVIMG
jgi:hypothetical protein